MSRVDVFSSTSGSHDIYTLLSVLIFDDSRKEQAKKLVLEITFSQPVLSVKMRYDR